MNHQLPTTESTTSLRSALVQLSNPTNLRIIHLLHQENITMNCVVSRKLEISTQLASKRLKGLVGAGLVTRERIFKRRYYRLDRERFTAIGVSLDILLRDLQQN